LVEKDDEIMDIARKVFSDLKKDYMCEFDWRWNIGKRYRRQDEIWTPYCITIDHQTKEDWTVTIRYRDTMKQERLKIEDIVF
jgi:glycyl-tRNA synthetase